MKKNIVDSYFREYFRPLTVFAFTIIKDEKVAEDIVQDVFVNLFEHAAKNDGQAIVNKNYLYRSVYNRCLNVVKFRKVRAEHNPHVQKHNSMLPDNPFQVVAKIELEHKLLEVIESLSPKCGHIFKLSRFNGLTNSEIASKLNLSKRTVETQISKALKILKRELSGYINF